MKKKFEKKVVLILSFLLWATSLGSVSGATLNSRPDSAIRAHGNNMVWMHYDSGQWDIYQLDMVSNKQVNITNDSNTQGYPDVWDKYVVWQEKSIAEDFHIYLYDMTTGVKKRISAGVGRHQEPRIADNKVVWTHENGNGKRVVILYDIKNDTLKQISSQDASAFSLELHENIVAWMDYRNGNFDIYIYDIVANKEKRITFGLEDEVDPLVSDGKVIWVVRYNGTKQVYMYDTNDGSITRLTVGVEDHTPLSFSEGSLLLIRGSELVLNNVSQIVDLEIETPSEDLPKQAFLLGNKVLWFDGQAFAMEEVNSAIKRAADKEQNIEQVAPPVNTGNSGSGPIIIDKKEEKSDFTLVKSNEDTLITTKDGIVTLKIEKGTFDKDVYISIQEENLNQTKDYQFLSPVYTWRIKEDIKAKKPIKLIMNYSSIKYQDNLEKILIYTQKDKQLIPLLVERDIKNKELKTEVSGNGNAVLSVFNKKFNDTKNHWSYEIVDVMASQHMISGYANGTFMPDQKMTRAEFVSILVKSGRFHNQEESLNTGSKNYFDDVSEDFWGASAINIAYEKGWISGHNGKFNPNDPITREQMIVILMNLYRENEQTKFGNTENNNILSQYRDKQEISSWAKDAMEKAVSIELIQGYNNRLTPLSNATRAEAATMIYRYLKTIDKL